MKGRDYGERQQLRSDRAAAGYTSTRVTKETLALLRQLLKVTPSVYGLDELLYELATAELERRQVKPVLAASERARLARENGSR